MFDNLSEKLQRVFKNLRGQGRLTAENMEAALREIRVALLEADVHFRVVKQLIENVKQQAMGEEVLTALSPAQQATLTSYVHGGGGLFVASMEMLSRLGAVPFRTNASLASQRRCSRSFHAMDAALASVCVHFPRRTTPARTPTRDTAVGSRPLSAPDTIWQIIIGPAATGRR